MREENQVRERVERLLKEHAALRQQAARAALSESAEDHRLAAELLDGVRCATITMKALDWVLGNKG